MIPDAPWIRDAENNGVGYVEPTEIDIRSADFQESVIEGLRMALEDVRNAMKWIEGTPEDTVWEDDIADMDSELCDVESQIEAMIEEVRAWEL